MATTQGKISQIIGPVVDVAFPEGGSLPALYTALVAERGGRLLTFEVVKHLEPGKVRAIALGSTDGLARGLAVTDTGRRLEVPVGAETLGNIFDVVGTSLTQPGKMFSQRAPIHREAPSLTEQSTKTEIFETGIKVVDLIA